jgi:hypothetical protein
LDCKRQSINSPDGRTIAFCVDLDKILDLDRRYVVRRMRSI